MKDRKTQVVSQELGHIDVFTGVFILKNAFLGRSASRDGVITPFGRYEDSAEPGAVHRSPRRRTRRRTRRRK